MVLGLHIAAGTSKGSPEEIQCDRAARVLSGNWERGTADTTGGHV
jgi:hypothetical protein